MKRALLITACALCLAASPAETDTADIIETKLQSTYTPKAAFRVVDLVLTRDVLILEPRRARNGRKIQIRLNALGGDRVVDLDDRFLIPSSSTMQRRIVVEDGTTSILLLDYSAVRNGWLIEAYVWGY